MRRAQVALLFAAAAPFARGGCFVYLEQAHSASPYVSRALANEPRSCTLEAYENGDFSAGADTLWVLAKRVDGYGRTRAAKECALFSLFREPLKAFLASYHSELWRRTNATYLEHADRADGRGAPSPVFEMLAGGFMGDGARRGRELRQAGDAKVTEAGLVSAAVLQGEIFDFVGAVERPLVTQLWWDAEMSLSNGKSWANVFETMTFKVEPLKREELQLVELFESKVMEKLEPDLRIYEAATSLLLAKAPRLNYSDVSACPAEPFQGGYLWLHSFGYAPNEPMQGEGLNGWRILFARVVALAKRLKMGIILPCVRHSVLVPCPVPPGRLQRADPLPNSGDDDLVDDDLKKAGVTSAMRKWLSQGLPQVDDDDDDVLEEAAITDDDAAETDDASRGAPVGMPVHDASLYFDVGAIAHYLGGSVDRAITVNCAAKLSEKHRQFTKLSWASARHTFPGLSKQVAQARKGPAKMSVVKYGGGFDLTSLKAVAGDEYAKVEATAMAAFAPRLHDAAGVYAQEHLGGGAFAVVHWRSETLVGRKDPNGPRQFEQCARLVLGEIAALKEKMSHVLLVTDIPASSKMPLWLSFDTKLDAAHEDMKPKLVAFVADAKKLGAKKYDDGLDASKVDLGDVAIIEQILGMDAAAFSTHRADDGEKLANWTGVRFDDCGISAASATARKPLQRQSRHHRRSTLREDIGRSPLDRRTIGYAGRFMRTIVTRRLAKGRPVNNWLVVDANMANLRTSHTWPKYNNSKPVDED